MARPSISCPSSLTFSWGLLFFPPLVLPHPPRGHLSTPLRGLTSQVYRKYSINFCSALVNHREVTLKACEGAYIKPPWVKARI